MTTGNGIPFLDLITPHLELEDQLMDAVRGVLRSAAFIGGPVLERFERDFAQFCNVEHCVGVSSGTDALRFALMAAGVGNGDIVITVPNTFVATIEAIIQAGATPQFVDIDPKTFNMSVDALGEYLKTQCDRSNATGTLVHRGSGRSVKAVIPVHLYGQIGDMDAIGELAEEYGLTVFEDACQAHGSEYFSAKKGKWQSAGSIGKAGAFSFYPGKNLGACGEAGAVTTNDESLAQSMRMIRDHGQNKKYHHLVEGYNGRLDALQAAILQVKLPHLKEWNAKRREAAETYNQLLQSVESVRTPFEPKWSKAVFHLYVICVRDRDDLQKHLTKNNIGTGLHYPIPLHLQKGYAHLGYREGDFPVTERLAQEILSLPMYPQMHKEQLEQVVQALAQFCDADAGARVLQS
jgi:dTDP-4-amino-4,6-dideoxygalactose transaminase